MRPGALREAGAVLAFGDLRLDIERRELRRGDELVDLQPKAFDLLAYLVQHRHRVVSKDDLLQAVWNGRIVSESALTTRINAARRALGDDGSAQRLIRTYARKGIRFIGEVTEIRGNDLSTTGETPARIEKPSIAVLPFQNLSSDREQDYFADGIVEEIITALSRIPWLFVIARNSSFTYKGKAVDVKQVAHELGVRYVLEGSVRRADKQLRIAGQLIDTATGAHIWAERFDGTLDEVFELQDRVADGVAGAIEPTLRVAEIARAVRKPIASLDVYDLYLRGLAKCHQRKKEGIAEGVWLLQQALALDPDYAPAMAVIGGLRCLQRNRHWIPENGIEVAEAIRLARQAIVSGNDDPDVLATAGYALAFLVGDNSTALSAIDRALALNPNFALAFGNRALVLTFLNRPDEAILAAQKALRLSPRDPKRFLFLLALTHANFAAGRYEAALSWAEEAWRENAGLPAVRFKLSLLGHLSRLDEASVCLHRLQESDCDATVTAVMRGHARGLAPEISGRLAEGLRKAGLPAK